jgi:hypothetical protein
MKALIDDGNHDAFALKAGLRRDVAANLKQVTLRYFKLIAPSQLTEVELAPAVTQCLRH